MAGKHSNEGGRNVPQVAELAQDLPISNVRFPLRRRKPRRLIFAFAMNGGQAEEAASRLTGAVCGCLEKRDVKK